MSAGDEQLKKLAEEEKILPQFVELRVKSETKALENILAKHG
jgi:hypothetical protein